MLLCEIFDQLSYGELANLTVVENNGITIENYPAIIPHINLALTALHKIFPLRMREIILQQYVSINIYHLTKEYAVNGGSAQPIKYLMDTPTDLFKNNLFKVEKVIDELGCEVPLNNVNEKTSVFTPTFNSLQVPNPTDDTAVSIIYRSDHEYISMDGLDADTYDVDIPMSLLEPLLFYIASRAYASVPMLDGVNQSASYLNKFEASIKRVKDLDLVNEDEKPNMKLDDNGWV